MFIFLHQQQLEWDRSITITNSYGIFDVFLEFFWFYMKPHKLDSKRAGFEYESFLHVFLHLALNFLDADKCHNNKRVLSPNHPHFE